MLKKLIEWLKKTDSEPFSTKAFILHSCAMFGVYFAAFLIFQHVLNQDKLVSHQPVPMHFYRPGVL